MLNISDMGLTKLYRLWSEEYYAASFISPSSDTVKIFRQWVKNLENTGLNYTLQDYEQSMIMEYYKQEHNNEV